MHINRAAAQVSIKDGFPWGWVLRLPSKYKVLGSVPSSEKQKNDKKGFDIGPWRYGGVYYAQIESEVYRCVFMES